MGHDQNFKNLILDYPHAAVSFFAEVEAQCIDAGARIVPIREEQLQERLGERFRELDVPLLVEWPDGRREALLLVFEQETEPRKFSIHRLAHYCLDLAELFGTERVVPIVIFLHPGRFSEHLILGGDAHVYLEFRYLPFALFQTPARQYLDSPNLVARLNLPNMAYDPAEKIEVYAQAVRGLLELEPQPERRLKYLDFIDIYADLDENERAIYQQRYPQEAEAMTGFAERFIEQGMQKGMQKGIQEGMQQGEAKVLVRQLICRFGDLPEDIWQQIESADTDTLLKWSERILTAQTLDEVLH
jgi:hypothetical protein